MPITMGEERLVSFAGDEARVCVWLSGRVEDEVNKLCGIVSVMLYPVHA